MYIFWRRPVYKSATQSFMTVIGYYGLCLIVGAALLYHRQGRGPVYTSVTVNMGGVRHARTFWRPQRHQVIGISQLHYNLTGPPSYMLFVVDGNVIAHRVNLHVHSRCMFPYPKVVKYKFKWTVHPRLGHREPWHGAHTLCIRIGPRCSLKHPSHRDHGPRSFSRARQ